MTDASIGELIGFAEHLADESRSLLAQAADGRASVTVKADRSLVTTTDHAVEARLRHLIRHAYPTHGVIGEEYGAQNPQADLTWVLDPLDGTAPFVAGIPVYGTLIGLGRYGRPWIGVLDYPATGDRWVGVSGQFATRNGTPVSTRPCPDLETAIVTCSSPDFLQPDELAGLARVRAAARYTLYGASSFAYGLLASGRTDLAVDGGLKLHDVFAPAAVVSGAGGVITEWSGAELTLGSSGARIVAAGDRERHAAVLALLGDAVKPEPGRVAAVPRPPAS